MAFTEDQLSVIEAAIAGGSLRVRFADGSEVTYQDLAGLMRARELMRGELQADSQTPPRRFTRVVHTRS